MNFKLKITTGIAVFALITSSSYSQAKVRKPAKTIYEQLHLKPGGCKLSDEGAEMEVVSEMVMPMDETESDQPRSDVSKIMNNCKPNFTRDTILTAKYRKKNSQLPAFENGNYLFNENGMYGLKNKAGQIILPANFYAVIPDGNKGFVAFENQFCNYYSTTGTKLLKQGYYFVKRTPKNTFIVQTESGFGVIGADNRFIVSPGYQSVDFVTIGGSMYYWLQKSNDRGFYLSENTKDTISVNDRSSVRYIDNEYWELFGRLINVKTKRYVICEPSYCEVVSVKYHLASITDNGTRKHYLIDFKGNLLTDQPFGNIGYFKDRNIAVATVNAEESTFHRSSGDYGVIDSKGRWVIKPVYSGLEFVNDTMLIAKDKNGLYGVISFRNREMVPFKYNMISKVNDSLILAVVGANDYNSDLIQIQQLKTVKSNLPYRRLDMVDKCSSYTFIAEKRHEECLLNEKYEPVGPSCYERVFYGPDRNSFIGTNFKQDGGVSDSHFFDCSGNVRTFKINGENYSAFDSYTQVSPNLYHILLTPDKGYFVTSNGKVTENNSHWQNIEYSNAKDLFVTMIYGGKYGIINGEGETVVPPVFEYISPFDSISGLARYDFDNYQKGYITTGGELLFGTTYQETKFLGLGLFKVKKGNYWGVVNRKGDIIVPVNYTDIKLNGGLLLAGSGGSVVYDLLGKRMD